MPQTLKTVRINQNGAGTQVIEAAVAGQRHIVVSYSLNFAAATALPQFESAATVIAGPYGSAVGSFGQAGTRESPLFACATNEALEVVVAGAGLVTGHVTYYTTSAGF